MANQFNTCDVPVNAPLASPAFTGNPVAPTQAAANNSTRLATTAYSDTGLALKLSAASNLSDVASKPAALSSLQLIARTVLGADGPTFDFTSIPATYEDLIIVLVGRTAAAATTRGVNVTFNGDTAGNYLKQRVIGNNATASAALSAAATSLSIGSVTGTTGTAGFPDMMEVTLPGYARTVFNKVCRSIQTNYVNGGSSTVVEIDAGWWASTAAITQVTLTCASSGNFLTGSVASLYGRS